MKKLSLLAFFVLNINILIAQSEKTELVTSFESRVEIAPKWTEGTNQEVALDLKSHITYPKEQCLSGVTILQFEVDTFGRVINPIVRRSIFKEIDEQLLRLIHRYRFEPGVLYDSKVKCTMTLPIRVRLD